MTDSELEAFISERGLTRWYAVGSKDSDRVRVVRAYQEGAWVTVWAGRG